MAVGAGLAIVVVAGLGEALAISEFQGVTWYVVRLLITVPFLLAWRAAIRADLRSAVAGSIILTAILSTYTLFLGPVGLPDLPLRIFETEAPGATSHYWLTYRQEFLANMPITLIVSLLVLAARSVRRGGSRRNNLDGRVKGAPALTAVLAVALAVAGGIIAAIWVDPDGDKGSVMARREVQVEQGAFYEGTLAPASGSLIARTIERNPRVTPLRPHDSVEVSADVQTPEGTVTVRADQPMVSDPLGRFTTWWGVGYDVWHHGRSGIGTALLPPTHSSIALFALGTVSLDGRTLASGVPVHVMTMEDGVELDVGQPGMPIEGLADGHLRAVWSSFDGGHSHEGEYARYAYGGLVLLSLLLLAGSAVAAEERIREVT